MAREPDVEPMVVEEFGDRVEITVPYRPGIADGCAVILAMVYLAAGVVAVVGILATTVFSPGPPSPDALEALGFIVPWVAVLLCAVIQYLRGRETISVSSEDLTIQARPFGLRRRYRAARVRDLRIIPVSRYQRWGRGAPRSGWIVFGHGLGTRRFGRYTDHDEARRIVRLIHRRFGMGTDGGRAPEDDRAAGDAPRTGE